MNKLTHMAGGLITAEAILFISEKLLALDTGTKIAIIGATVAGSLLPDIDHPNSTASRKLPIARLFYLLLSGGAQHRRGMHSIIAALPWAIFGGLANGRWRFIGAGIALGYLSHILLDCLTPQGCMLFFPIKRQIVFGGKIRTGGISEACLAALLILGCISLGTRI